MVKLPNILKSVAGAGDDEPENETIDSAPEGGSDILNALGIVPAIKLPEDILSAQSIKKTQFNIAQPRGYYVKDVDQFMGDILMTVDYLIDALKQRDKDVRTLGNEFNRLNTNLLNQKMENEFTHIQSQFGNDSKTTETMNRLNSENANLRQEIAELEHKLLSLTNKLQGSHASVDENASQPLTDDERAQFEQWSAEVSQAYDALELTNQQLQEEIISLTQERDEAFNLASEWEQYANSVQNHEGYEYADEAEPAAEYAEPVQYEEPVEGEYEEPYVEPVGDEYLSTDGLYAQGTDYVQDQEHSGEYAQNSENVDETGYVENPVQESYYSDNSISDSGHDEELVQERVQPVQQEQQYVQEESYEDDYYENDLPFTPEVSTDDYYVDEYDEGEDELNEFVPSTPAFVQEEQYQEQVPYVNQDTQGTVFEAQAFLDENGSVYYSASPNGGEGQTEPDEGMSYVDELFDQESTPRRGRENKPDPQYQEEPVQQYEEENYEEYAEPEPVQEAPKGGSIFDSLLSEIKHDQNSDAPELGEGLVRPRNRNNLEDVNPNTPLTSIPPDSVQDYL